jgi:hypothetical protein
LDPNFVTEEELLARKNRKFGLKTLRRGGTSLNQEEKDRAQWYRDLQAKVFMGSKRDDMSEEEDYESSEEEQEEAEEEEEKETEEEKMEREAREEEEMKLEEEKERQAKEEALKKAENDLLNKKPEFSNFLLDLGNESAEREQREKEEAELKKKNLKPLPKEEFYIKSANFDASKWLVKINNLESDQLKSRLFMFPGLGEGAWAYRKWALTLAQEGN